MLEKKWKETENITNFLTSCESSVNKEETESDLLQILTSIIHKTNIRDTDEFTSSTQLDVEEPETYKQVIYGPHRRQWVQAMKEKLDQLEKNETWTLVPKHSIELGYKTLSGKWVFKVKQDVNGAIMGFKA